MNLENDNRYKLNGTFMLFEERLKILEGQYFSDFLSQIFKLKLKKCVNIGFDETMDILKAHLKALHLILSFLQNFRGGTAKR